MIVTGLLGAILALATPFLPVQQDAASISWPQNGSLTNVEAPLVSYTPQQLHESIPCVYWTVGTATLPHSMPVFAPHSMKWTRDTDGKRTMSSIV